MKKNIFYSICFLFIFFMDTSAQDLELIWQGEAGEIPVETLMSHRMADPGRNLMDINNDGINDITVFRTGEDTILFVKDGESGNNIVQFGSMDFRGWEEGVEAIFLQLDPASSLKEMVVGIPSNNSLFLGEVQLGIHNSNQLQAVDQALKLVQFNDFNKDGKIELVFINVPEQRLEIWSIK